MELEETGVVKEHVESELQKTKEQTGIVRLLLMAAVAVPAYAYLAAYIPALVAVVAAVAFAAAITALVLKFVFLTTVRAYTEMASDTEDELHELWQGEMGQFQEIVGHRLDLMDEHITAMGAYVRAYDEARGEVVTRRIHADRARAMAFEFVSSLYTGAGGVDPDKVLATGMLQVRAPWSKRGSWSAYLADATSDEGTRATSYLTIEPPNGGPPLFERTGQNFALNLAHYPTLGDVRKAF